MQRERWRVFAGRSPAACVRSVLQGERPWARIGVSILAVGLLWGCGTGDFSPRVPDPRPADELPKPEHPRPDFERDDWFNLNGRWDFVTDPEDRGEREAWFLPGAAPFDRKILVPFPWESPASGLDASMRAYRGAAWYGRSFRVPGSWAGLRVLLRFGAVDWSARVWVNGVFAGEHEGGYSPFALDVTDTLTPGENVLTVRAWDPGDTDPQIPRGKQGGLWYTHASGIWQTVYLEPVPEAHVETIRITPRPEASSVRVRLGVSPAAGGLPLRARFVLTDPDQGRREFVFPWEPPAGGAGAEFTLPLESQRLWSPEHPNLYGLRICLESPSRAEEDCVRTYFGQRRVEARWAPGRSPAERAEATEQYKYIYLNGEPVYLRGLLDQSYHPEGVYTYPDEESLKRDLVAAKEMGFNFLRVHIKIDEPRRIYWADRLGLLVMADIPSAGHFAVNTEGARCRPLWEGVMRRALERDFGHPSIFAWCNFNETWGLTLPVPLRWNPSLQEWVRRMYFLARELDPTRLVEDHSPTDFFRDHVATDVNSWHFYLDNYDLAREHLERVDRETFPGSPAFFVGGGVQDGAPLLCSEFGSVDAFAGNRDVSWGFKYLVGELRRHPKVCGYVYTQLTDVEWEYNGLLRYDRSPKEFGYEEAGIRFTDLSGADFLVLHTPPAVSVEPGADLSLSAAVSFFSSGTPPGDAALRWKLSGTDGLGRPVEGPEGGPVPVRLDAYGLSEAVPVSVRAPSTPLAGRLLLWAESPGTGWRVSNFLPVEVRAAGGPPRQERDAAGWVLRWKPGALAAAAWSGGPARLVSAKGGGGGEAAGGLGSGFFAYRVPVPQGLAVDEIAAVELLLEASSAPGVFNTQSDESRTPSRLSVILNDLLLGETELPDAPADIRGFLSYLNAGTPALHGSYGYLVAIELPAGAVPALRDALNAEGSFRVRLEVAEGEDGQANGLRVYGDRLGRYAVDPTLRVTTSGSGGSIVEMPWGLPVFLDGRRVDKAPEFPYILTGGRS